MLISLEPKQHKNSGEVFEDLCIKCHLIIHILYDAFSYMQEYSLINVFMSSDTRFRIAPNSIIPIVLSGSCHPCGLLREKFRFLTCSIERMIFLVNVRGAANVCSTIVSMPCGRTFLE